MMAYVPNKDQQDQFPPDAELIPPRRYTELDIGEGPGPSPIPPTISIVSLGPSSRPVNSSFPLTVLGSNNLRNGDLIASRTKNVPTNLVTTSQLTTTNDVHCGPTPGIVYIHVERNNGTEVSNELTFTIT